MHAPPPRVQAVASFAGAVARVVEGAAAMSVTLLIKTQVSL